MEQEVERLNKRNQVLFERYPQHCGSTIIEYFHQPVCPFLNKFHDFLFNSTCDTYCLYTFSIRIK